jgi:hypothetical protein
MDAKRLNKLMNKFENEEFKSTYSQTNTKTKKEYSKLSLGFCIDEFIEIMGQWFYDKSKHLFEENV